MTWPGHIAVILAGLILLAPGASTPVFSEVRSLPAAVAHELASRGDIVLVDIRAPEEWRHSGVGASAIAISMHRSGFLDKLKAALGGDKTRPVALICAAGVRTARMAQILSAQGYRRIIDVSEGMFGSAAGPGWIRRGLPIRAVPGN